jgi:mRNA-degrading endonuclease RelE of RelBE toxin-antitoxin system
VTKRVVFSAEAQTDLASLDRSVALRIVGAINRFATTGAGNVQGLRGIHPPEFRLRVGDWRVRFHDHGDWLDILRVRNRREAYKE